MVRRLFALSAATFVVALVAAPGALGAGLPHVDAAVQVTTTPSPYRAYASPVVAVDPRNPKVVVVADAETRSSSCGLQVSTDGGLSWREGASPQPTGAPGVSATPRAPSPT